MTDKELKERILAQLKVSGNLIAVCEDLDAPLERVRKFCGQDPVFHWKVQRFLFPGPGPATLAAWETKTTILEGLQRGAGISRALFWAGVTYGEMMDMMMLDRRFSEAVDALLTQVLERD